MSKRKKYNVIICLQINEKSVPYSYKVTGGSWSFWLALVAGVSVSLVKSTSLEFMFGPVQDPCSSFDCK